MGRINFVLKGALVVMLALVLAATSIFAATEVDTSALRDAVSVENVRAHQAELQAIADANGGTRMAGSPGYDDSVEYVAEMLIAAGYEVTIQEFDFDMFRQLGPSTLEQTATSAVTYLEEVDFNLMSYSAEGDVTGLVTAVDLELGLDNSSDSGCEPEDFTGFPAGNIALIQRGACTFQLKAENAAAAGAFGVIIFNQGNTPDRTGLINGTLSADYVGGIPVFFATTALGEEWSQTNGLELRMVADVFSGTVTTSNVLAETPGGRDDRVVVVGAHLDSVESGPGIQDNGSGSAAILEVALQMSDLGIEPRNKVRFAWWGAEEAGLVGSTFYVDNLSPREIKNIALNLNFDMIGSPNFVRFVYDGDGSATELAGPNGSKNIEQVFLNYFEEQGLPTLATAFDGRSDYGPFVEVGIPAGGLFTGAEGIKTEEEAFVFGGTAGDQYDPCYHLACDTFDNISLEVLDQNADAIAHSILTFAQTTSAVNGTDKGMGLGKWKNGMSYLGSQATK